ncbi:MAG: hypothetical protein AB3N12_01520 [Ruegeria sp.]
MCVRPKAPKIKTPKPQPVSAAPQLIAAPHSVEANQAGDIEAKLRRRRAGAAANVLTSPTGIPGTSQLGAPS